MTICNYLICQILISAFIIIKYLNIYFKIHFSLLLKNTNTIHLLFDEQENMQHS